jgi:precorrin-2 methylase
MTNPPNMQPEEDDSDQLSDDMKVLLAALGDPNLYEEFGNIDTPLEHRAVKPGDVPPTSPPSK